MLDGSSSATKGRGAAAQPKGVADLPAADAYRAAIADLSATLTGSNVEAARSALRGLVGNVSVFAEGRKLYGRIGLNPAQLLRTSNPGFIRIPVRLGAFATQARAYAS